VQIVVYLASSSSFFRVNKKRTLARDELEVRRCALQQMTVGSEGTRVRDNGAQKLLIHF